MRTEKLSELRAAFVEAGCPNAELLIEALAFEAVCGMTFDSISFSIPTKREPDRELVIRSLDSPPLVGNKKDGHRPLDSHGIKNLIRGFERDHLKEFNEGFLVAVNTVIARPDKEKHKFH